MELTTFGLTWLIIMLIGVLEAYFTVPYDREFKEELKKRKNEHKSTS